jgi:hypothetical protein
MTPSNRTTRVPARASGPTCSSKKRWTACSSMKIRKKTNCCLSSTTPSSSKTRSENRANFATRSSRCSAPPCTTAKSVGRLSATRARGRNAASPKWKRRSTACAMSATVSCRTTTSSACTHERSTIKRISSRKSLSASSRRRRRFLSARINYLPLRLSTSKSCRKLSRSKEFAINK